MGRDVYPFSTPSTVSSTPSQASTLAMELQPYSSTGGTPFAKPKEVETVKRQVLQTTPPSRMGAQQEATTPGMEGSTETGSNPSRSGRSTATSNNPLRRGRSTATGNNPSIWIW